MTRTISQNLETLRRQISSAEQRYHRNSSSVQLIAVSKTQPAEKLREAYQAGQRAFGENYLQEGLDKITALNLPEIEWHFIGPIQSNKTRAIATHFDWVHSVDRLKIAARLNEQRPTELPPLNICLQINISAEDSKSGTNTIEALTLAKEICKLPRLTLRGLMAIPSHSDDATEQRKMFSAMQQLLLTFNATLPMRLDTLSMGMSGDMDAAIAEGATMVRIGTGIFGTRQSL